MKTLALQFNIDEKDIRRVVAMVTGEALTDDELQRRFIDRQPVVFDVTEESVGETYVSMVAAYVTIMLADEEKAKGNE